MKRILAGIIAASLVFGSVDMTEYASQVGDAMTIEAAGTDSDSVEEMVSPQEEIVTYSDEIGASQLGVEGQETELPATGDQQQSGDFSYYENTDSITIYKYTGNATSCTVPATINGKQVTEIGEQAFMEKENLVTVQLPSTINRIGSIAFGSCTSLQSINLPEGITDLDSTFWGCTSLKTITIPAGVTRLSGTFRHCWNLTTVYLPDGLREIGNWTFGECWNLKNIEIPDSVTKIVDAAFLDCNSLQDPFPISKNVTELDGGAFEDCEMKEFVVDPLNPNYCSVDGVIFSKDMTELVKYPEGSPRSSYVIPQQVTNIQNIAFGTNSKTYYDGEYIAARRDTLKRIDVLNANCDIGGACFEYFASFGSSITLYGHKGSTTEQYAKSHGVKFHSLDPCSGHKFVGVDTKPATCTAKGVRTYTCSECGDTYTEDIAMLSHSYTTQTIKATTAKNGSITKKCSRCGKIESTTTIYYPRTIKLSATSYTYNGKTRKPSVTVKDSKGKALKKGTDYAVSMPKSSKTVGSYTVSIKFMGNYSGTIKKTYTIIPKTTSLITTTAKSKAIAVGWKKQTTQTSGYQLQYSTSGSFTKSTTKTVTVTKNGQKAKTITKLKPRKRYYVRIRTYKSVKINGKATRIYSGWSAKKTVVTKK